MLKPLAFKPFTPSELQPRGWLRRQLEIQAEGLGGNLDLVWPDVRDSQWIGGDREGWERVPYWLDGFIPLAWLLNDKSLKERAKRYIDHILERQQDDGWLCPCVPEERARYDLWALILIAKVFTVYADCSGDSRIQPALKRALHCFADHVDAHTLFDWGAARWFEALIPIFWLYERNPEPWLLDLAHRLQVQGFDYDRLFSPYLDRIPQRKWTFQTHVVNLAMCLKSGALMSRINGDDPDTFAHMAQETLFQSHGTAFGHFTGDECTAGRSPIQGTELCGVVEAMFSYETLLSISGSAAWGDALERLAFNALPAAISPDMWTHQYDQLTNQPQCSRMPDGKAVFTTNSEESHLFGLEPNFGCCTANFHQGWPKFALSAFMYTEDGLVSALPVPSEVHCRIRDIPVRCSLETEYPFQDELCYTLCCDAPVFFSLQIRIPGTATSAKAEVQTENGHLETVSPVPGTFLRIERQWSGITKIRIHLVFEATLFRRPDSSSGAPGLYFLQRGPLIFSVSPKERWEKREYIRNGVERKFPYCDYEIFPESSWNYGFRSTRFTVEKHLVSKTPFSPAHPPISIDAEMIQVEWPFSHGVCSERPGQAIPGTECVLKLIPYGCTNLRMTELPLISNSISSL